jgi:hypothetical protein
MKTYLFLAVMLLGFNSFAIRHIGPGGGDAENIVLRMADNLPAWSKACQENKGFCEVPFLAKPLIEFEGDAMAESICENSTVIIPIDLLYVGDKTPKNNYELAAILVQAVYRCQFPEKKRTSLLRLLPLGKSLPGTSVSAFEGKQTDVLVSLRAPQSLHQELLKQTTCSNYRVVGQQNQMFLVNCPDKGWNFLVSVEESATGTVLRSRYQGSAD